LRLRSSPRFGAQAWPLQGSARQGSAFISAKKSLALFPPPNHSPLSFALLVASATLRQARLGQCRAGHPKITHSVSKLIRLLAEYIGKPWPASALSSLRCGQSVRNGQGYGRKLGTVLATLRAEPRQRPYKALARRLHIWPTARASGRSSAQEQKLQTF